MNPGIQVVLVLYKLQLAESPAWQSLQSIAATLDPRQLVSLLVYDNSPEPQPPLPSMIPTRYVSDVTNSGLARAYNTALELADEHRSSWLLVLDQDTVLTAEYWAELTKVLPDLPQQVAAVVPRLLERRFVHSPTHLPRLKHVPVTSPSGLLPTPVTAFNSGVLFRVAALTAGGGFDARFPLEFSDHAIFHRLQAEGGRVWLMEACLEHRLSTYQLGMDAKVERYLTMLRAERNFYHEYGTTLDRLFYRMRRAKQSIGQLLQVPDKRFALLSVRAALGLLP